MYNLSCDCNHRLWWILLVWPHWFAPTHSEHANMFTSYHYNTEASTTLNLLQTCFNTTYHYNTKASSISRRYLCWSGFVSKTCRKLPACLPPSFTVSCRGCVAEYAHAQLSRICLPATCDITHVIPYTRRLFYFGVRGPRGRPGDEATNNLGPSLCRRTSRAMLPNKSRPCPGQTGTR